MRLTTLASIVVLAVSTAALAQVGTAPVEQKIPAGNAAAADDAMAGANTSAAANEAAPGAPSTALVNSTATDHAHHGGPPRQ
jgi:hypothetical protein